MFLTCLSLSYVPDLSFRNEIHKELLFFWRYTGEEIISISNDLFNKNNVLWENSIKATTDRVDASGAIHKGLQVRVIEITPNMKFTQR